MDQTPAHPPARPAEEPDTLFVDLVRTHNKGSSIGDISADLREVTTAAVMSGKAASLALKITITPADSSGEVMKITYETTKKLPKKPSTPSIYFVDEGSGLTRHDTRQMEMFAPRAVRPAEPAPAPIAAPATPAAAHA